MTNFSEVFDNLIVKSLRLCASALIIYSEEMDAKTNRKQERK